MVRTERTVPHVLSEANEFSAPLEVSATAYLVAVVVVEWAYLRPLNELLDESTLGERADINHHAPTLPGGMVGGEMELTHIDDRQLMFDVGVRDDEAVMSRGTHRRAVVSVSRFQPRLRARAARVDVSS